MLNSMKLITFVVPSFNSENYLERCIDSLLPAGNEAEIIIVNDGSTDNTGKIADNYAGKYPDIVRVIHKENGGHGSGINAGIQAAEGIYFKVVDSDDWVDNQALKTVIETLGSLETSGGCDLFITNYVYYNTEKGPLKTVRYKSLFNENKICGWSNAKRIKSSLFLTLHSCIYKTEAIKKSGIRLPEHIFYEDNLFIYAPLYYAEKVYYCNADFYIYLVGREGQSVGTDMLKKRCTHQITVAEKIFAYYDFDKVRLKNKKLYSYMYRESLLMTVMACIFTRLNSSDKHDKLICDMWDFYFSSNQKYAKKMRHSLPSVFVNIKGKPGRCMCKLLFKAAHRVMHFN